VKDVSPGLPVLFIPREEQFEGNRLPAANMNLAEKTGILSSRMPDAT
jgi:hypothetical protein